MREPASDFLFPATTRWPLMRGSSRLAGAALLSAILAACGGSDGSSAGGGGGGNAGVGAGPQPAVAALPSFDQQTLNWQDCGAAFFDADSEQQHEIALLGARAQCALMRVPQDYGNQLSTELQIEVLTVAAEQPSRRLGAIVLNPGGPGIDGLHLAPELAMKLVSAEAGEGSALLREMSRRFDLVAFSPRGTGRHSRLNCKLQEALVAHEDFIVDPGLENLRKIQHNARVLAEGCAATPMSKHIHTEATARDMDLLRGLLGEAKLNYIGYSYGGWLGAWYAGLFPERVGRMLLDSSPDINQSLEDAELKRADAEQQLVDGALLAHVARLPARYGLGTDATALRNRLLALPARLVHALVSEWNIEDSSELDQSAFDLVSVLKLQQLLGNAPYPPLSVLEARINASALFAQSQVREMALYLAPKLYAAQQPEMLFTQDFVYWSVACNDSGTRRSVGSDGYWNSLARDFVARTPFALERYSYNPCVNWTEAPRQRPAITEVQKAGPMLLLHSMFDVVAPLSGALEAWKALPNSRLLVVDEEYQHRVFPYGTACVDNQVANYFLNGDLPESSTVKRCAGRERVLDDDQDTW